MDNRFDILIHVQPWQGLLYNPEQLLDLAVGELGATGITFSVKAAESQDAIALSPTGELLAMRLAPGALWQPDAEQYASTRLRPQTSATLKSRQPAGRLAEVCRDRGQAFRLRLSVLRDAGFAARHPEAVSCNALSLPGHSLCPSNPDVVELVRCQLLDLAGQFEPAAIEIENFTRPNRYRAAAGTAACWPTAPGAIESGLLALCFCPSCQQQANLAGLDAAAALRSVQVRLGHWLHDERVYAGTMNNLLADDAILAEYIAHQRHALLASIQLWVRAVPKVSLVVAKEKTAVHRGTAGASGTGGAGSEPDAIDHLPRGGSPWNPSFEELAGVAPRLTLLIAPNASAHACECPPEGEAGSRVPLEAAIDATSPSFASGPDIVRCLSDIARSGAAGIELESGLHVSPSRRAFIRQAIRAARRERSP